MSPRKEIIQARLPVTFFKEGETFIVYSPVLDLSSCGSTFESARKNFNEALTLFFDSCLKHDTLDEALELLGWQLSRDNQWEPPVVVGQESLPVAVPAHN